MPTRPRSPPPARPGDPVQECACEPSFVEPAGAGPADRVELVVDAGDCEGGDLAASPACRATVVGALAARNAAVVRVRSRGLERSYDDDAAGLLLAAGRFAERVEPHDPQLAARALVDPPAAGREAAGRAGPVRNAAVESGLAEGAGRFADLETVLVPHIGPTLARSRIDPSVPTDARLVDARELPTGATARLYAGPERAGTAGRAVPTRYHLEPAEAGLEPAAFEALADAATLLADGVSGKRGGDTSGANDRRVVHDDRRAVGDDRRAVRRAVRHVTDDGNDTDDTADVDRLTDVLHKYTLGLGVFEDLFADGRLTDVYATAPVESTPIRVVVDGDELPTNVHLTTDGVETLASRVRRESGRGFSRASPRIDATLPTMAGGRVRVAGVTRPLADGTAFALRRGDDDAWTLPRLVASDTATPGSAALLSLAVERGAAILVTGSRGAGKTATLEALVRELPLATRTVIIEDTPELPVADLQAAGRDVQALRTAVGVADDSPGVPPATALRTALRLGDGALVVGEVRGEEARVLYEAMRVGGAADAVLGTIHGADAAAVRERVVTDLGVPASSFAATDLIVTVAADGGHRLDRIDEVNARSDGVSFAPLYATGAAGLEATTAMARGESVLLAGLAGPGETYADVRAAVRARAERLERLADAGVTTPAALQRARSC